MVYLGLGAFVFLADRIAVLIRRRHFEQARLKAVYPLTDSTNWRQPSG
jgi:hypothetical protein